MQGSKSPYLPVHKSPCTSLCCECPRFTCSPPERAGHLRASEPNCGRQRFFRRQGVCAFEGSKGRSGNGPAPGFQGGSRQREGGVRCAGGRAHVCAGRGDQPRQPLRVPGVGADARGGLRRCGGRARRVQSRRRALSQVRSFCCPHLLVNPSPFSPSPLGPAPLRMANRSGMAVHPTMHHQLKFQSLLVSYGLEIRVVCRTPWTSCMTLQHDC